MSPVDLTRYTTSCGYLKCEVCNAGPTRDWTADVCDYAGKTIAELIAAAEAHEAEHHAGLPGQEQGVV